MLSLTGLASLHSPNPPPPATPPPPYSPPPYSPPPLPPFFPQGMYVITHVFNGSDSTQFFSQFDFQEEADPARKTLSSNPYTDFVSDATAFSAGLLTRPALFPPQSDSVYIGVDHSNAFSFESSTRQRKDGRKSVRLLSKELFGEGLFVLDFKHIPEGCATARCASTLS